MSGYTKFRWYKRDRLFLEVMKEYAPRADLLNKKFSRLGPVWTEISKKVNLPAKYCQFKWYSIKYRYFMLKNMIHIGRVTEQMVLDNPKTWKYLDGRLDFLDPYIFDIPPEKLTNRAHRFFNTAFAGITSAHSTTVADREKKDYRLESRNEPTSILPDIDSDIEEVFDSEMYDPTAEKKIDENNPVEEKTKKKETRNIKENCNMEVIKDSQQKSRNEPACILSDADSDIEEVFDLEIYDSTMEKNIDESSDFVKEGEKEIKKNKTKQVKDNCNLGIIKVYQQELRKEPTSILPDIDSDIEEVFDLEMYDSTKEKKIDENNPVKEGKKEIKQNKTRQVKENCKVKIIKNFQQRSKHKLKQLTTDNEDIGIEEVFDLEIDNATPEKRTESEKRKYKKASVRDSKRALCRYDCPLAQFLIKHSDTACEEGQESDLMEYMRDLAEVLCTRLVPEKRQAFLDQVDLIVSDILEEVE